jgi:hypothetical protein
MGLRKVYGGTPVGSESRCDTCVQARIIQGYAESERIVFCTSLYDPIQDEKGKQPWPALTFPG